MEELMGMPIINFGNMTKGQRELFGNIFGSIDSLPNCVRLYCNNINLNRLPKLPNCTLIACYNNRLSELPELPVCEYLSCVDNQLRNLPDLPECSTLICSYNQLRTLPNLPNCTHLECARNQLHELPDLPECTYVYCNNNQLTKLPDLPKCKTLFCSNNKQLYYSKSIASKFGFGFTYPSSGHHIHYVREWQTAYNKLRKIKLLQHVNGMDEYLAYEIIRKID